MELDGTFGVRGGFSVAFSHQGIVVDDTMWRPPVMFVGLDSPQ